MIAAEDRYTASTHHPMMSYKYNGVLKRVKGSTVLTSLVVCDKGPASLFLFFLSLLFVDVIKKCNH